jgi:zinc/manganese transport system permease protein
MPTGPTWNLLADVQQMFALHFMVNAFRAGTIVAVLAGAIGWFMVLRRQSFAGHTLAIVSYPGAAGAVLLGLSASLGYYIAAVAAALVIAAVPRSPSGQSYGEESAVIGTVQAFALASGALFVSLYGGFLNSQTSLLFGTFLGISNDQVVVLLVVAVVSLGVLCGIGRPLFFATVDADVAIARGVPGRLLSLAFLVLLGCAAAAASQITGALLVFSLLVMPAAAAQLITARPAVSFALTLLLAVVVTWLALGAAFYTVYPVGFWLTSFGFGLYVIAAVATGSTKLGRRRRALGPAIA